MKWYEHPATWLFGVSALVVGYLERDTLSDIAIRGDRLTFSTLDPWHPKDHPNGTGLVSESPESLAMAASGRFGSNVSLDVNSLARMIRSEGAAQGKLRAHVALNDLDGLGWNSLHYLLTYSTDKSRRGLYGQQYSPAVLPKYPSKNSRRYATSKDPYAADVRTAIQAIYDHRAGIDPSQGAVKFLDREALASQGGARDFATIDAEWRGDGLKPFSLPAYGDDLILYKRA